MARVVACLVLTPVVVGRSMCGKQAGGHCLLLLSGAPLPGSLFVVFVVLVGGGHSLLMFGCGSCLSSCSLVVAVRGICLALTEVSIYVH